MAGEETKYGGISSQAVAAKTGKGWQEWIDILDAAGAREMGHSDIATYLSQVQGVPDWWCQMVTVGYEQARGLRVVHQKSDGFTANASKTVGVPIERLYAAWADEAQRSAWMGPADHTVRRATENKSLRIVWGDGSAVDVGLYPKGDAKSQVAIQHSKLAGEEESASIKAFWSAALARLEDYLKP